MKAEESETTARLIGMVEELDLTHQLDAARVLNNLLKVQRGQKRIERKAEAVIDQVRKFDVVTADHLQAGDSQCSFCKKWQSDLELLIAGPDGVFICNECIDVCTSILKERKDADS